MKGPSNYENFTNGVGNTESMDIQVMEGLFRLRNVTIVGYFYYLILLKLLHVSVVLPSSGRNILTRIYSTDIESVVFRIYTQQDANTQD
jgi:hypothetical protein